MNVTKKTLIVLFIAAAFIVLSIGGYAVYRLGPLSPLGKHVHNLAVQNQTSQPTKNIQSQAAGNTAATNQIHPDSSARQMQPVGSTMVSDKTAINSNSTVSNPVQNAGQSLQNTNGTVAGMVNGLAKSSTNSVNQTLQDTQQTVSGLLTPLGL